ncbi:hypothetical protein [Cerasicoccus frondis]|uniref:hypothetical protein n=1 Tax=Cerasicoccus frondis TaxID=490090 RepID=UPI00285249AA|nr:hypothetical protein [Cerasicoccus frondis]
MKRPITISVVAALALLSGCSSMENSEEELDYSTQMKAQQAEREAEERAIQTSGFRNYHEEPAQVRF